MTTVENEEAVQDKVLELLQREPDVKPQHLARKLGVSRSAAAGAMLALLALRKIVFTPERTLRLAVRH